MNYQQTLDYLFSMLPMYQRIGAAAYKADLTNTVELCRILDNPQDSFRSIHITGTNGKGSVSHLIASILQDSGLKVGLYTSPHLKDFRERIRVNGKMIPKIKVTGFVKEHLRDFEAIQPSFFEMTVGLAFDFFREENIDVGVIEAGLGGRLDSTNILTPVLSIITNVSFDHMQFLGNTLESIAGEKAGIIKKGVPVIIGETQDETSQIFIQQAKKNETPVIFADQHFQCRLADHSFSQKDLLVVDILHEQKPYLAAIESPLAGLYQKKNITTVIAACEQLRSSGVAITEKNIFNGIRNVVKNTGLFGRWQILSHEPLTICDTGHNTGGLKEVIAQIDRTPHHRLHFVFGLVNDKAIDAMLRMLPKDATYYFCKANIPRGMDPGKLKRLAAAEGLQGESYNSVKEALESAQNAAGNDDLVFIGGSTFVVAEVV